MTQLFNLRSTSERQGNYVAGFVDGEGSFYTSIRFIPDSKTKWRFSLNFAIGNNDKRVLEFCRAHLCCGNIRTVDSKKFLFEVSNLFLLDQNIIPFFKQFQFVSNKKRHEFRVFQLLVHFLKEETIDSMPKLTRFLYLRKLLSRHRSERSSYSDDFILKTFCPVSKS